MTIAPDPDEPTLAALAGRAIDDGRAVARTEIALLKARMSERVAAYRGALVLFAVAGVLSLSALVALLVGLILSLATLIGPGWSTAAVVLGTLVIAGILALVGKARLTAPDLGKTR